MNFHKSKGKEFDEVIVVERKFRGEFFNENWEDPPFTECRRVLRVAITRARERANGCSTRVAKLKPEGILARARRPGL